MKPPVQASSLNKKIKNWSCFNGWYDAVVDRCWGRAPYWGKYLGDKVVSLLDTWIAPIQCSTSVLHWGLMVLHTTLERFSWPWWGSEGKMLCLPGWMESFRYGSGLKNIPFFSPTACRSERQSRHCHHQGALWTGWQEWWWFPSPDREKLMSLLLLASPGITSGLTTGFSTWETDRHILLIFISICWIVPLQWSATRVTNVLLVSESLHVSKTEIQTVL